MATCPVDAIISFLQVTDPQTLTANKNILNSTAPFRPAFADSAIFNLGSPAQITTDSNNTIAFRGNSYSFQDAQICSPIVNLVASTSPKSSAGRGIMTNGTNPIAELLLTFVNPTLVNTTVAVIVILPIYSGTGTAGANNLLTSFLTNPISLSVTGSLNSLFTDGFYSYGYNACISTVPIDSNTAVNGSIRTYILSFPDGYVLNATMSAIFIGSPLPEYIFHPAQPNRIATNFALGDTDFIVNGWDQNTFYCNNSHSSNSNIITDNVIHYMQSPFNLIGKKSALFTLDQYKCYPFSELKNLQTDPNTAAKYVVPMDKAVNSLEATGGGFSVSTVGYWILGIIGIMALIALIYVLIMYFSTEDDVSVADAAAAEAAAPAAL